MASKENVVPDGTEEEATTTTTRTTTVAVANSSSLDMESSREKTNITSECSNECSNSNERLTTQETNVSNNNNSSSSSIGRRQNDTQDVDVVNKLKQELLELQSKYDFILSSSIKTETDLRNTISKLTMAVIEDKNKKEVEDIFSRLGLSIDESVLATMQRDNDDDDEDSAPQLKLVLPKSNNSCLPEQLTGNGTMTDSTILQEVELSTTESLARRHNEHDSMANSSEEESSVEKKEVPSLENRLEDVQHATIATNPSSSEGEVKKDIDDVEGDSVKEVISVETRQEDAVSEHTITNPSSNEGGLEKGVIDNETQQEDAIAESNHLEDPSSALSAAGTESFNDGGAKSQTATNPSSSEGRSEKEKIALETQKEEDAVTEKTMPNPSSREAGLENEITPPPDRETQQVDAVADDLENAPPEETIKDETKSFDDVGCDASAGGALHDEVVILDMEEEDEVVVLDITEEENEVVFLDTKTENPKELNECEQPENSRIDAKKPAAANTATAEEPAKSPRTKSSSPSSSVPFDREHNRETINLLSDSDSSSSVPSTSGDDSDAGKNCDEKQRALPRKRSGRSLQTNPAKKPRVLRRKTSGPSVQNNALQSTVSVSTRVSVPRQQPTQSLQASRKRPLRTQITSSLASSKSSSTVTQISTRISVPSQLPPLLRASRKRTTAPTTQIISSVASSTSTRISVPSQPPPLLQASRKRRPAAAPTQIASIVASSSSISSSKSKNEASTSMSRHYPDPSDAIKAITRWQPPKAVLRKHHSGGSKQFVEFHGHVQFHHKGLEKERDNPLLQPARTGRGRDVPKEFKNASEIMEAFGYPLVNEGICSINQEYHSEKLRNGRWSREWHRLKLTKLTEVTPIVRSESYFCDDIKMYEAQLNFREETKLPPTNPSELYCVYFPGWQGSKFGVSGSDFPTTIPSLYEGKLVLKLWLIVHPNDKDTEQTGWLSQNDFKKLLDPQKTGLTVKQHVIFTLLPCGSVTNVVRQFEAIKSLTYLKPHLQKALFAASTEDSTKPASTSTSALTTIKPRSLPIDIWRSLTGSNNSYQLSSISRVLTGNCKENICLIQGPPGTGKSSTIAGLVSALLSGKAPLPKQRQSGCLIHAGNTVPPARNRILVCAATNQAVDSLAWKINQGSIGPSGNRGEFAMARFGSLPWERSRETGQKPNILSDMEKFLYEINVDTKANQALKDLENSHDPQEESENNDSKRRKRTKTVGRAKLRSHILSNSSVILATLSGSGSKAFIEAVSRDSNKNDSEFDAVIIDEACQASEPESLIPFKYNPTTITLVGDPQQLPVLSLAGSTSYTKMFERSLFERLQSLNFTTILLRNQYRMHQDIATFPSEQFYQGKLITPDSVKNRPSPSWSCTCLPPICFWDTKGRNMIPNGRGNGFSNKEEADFITRTILSTLADTFLNKSGAEVTVGIISFYRDQVNLLKEQLTRIPGLKNSRLKVKVATVDGFQGSECDIIILSCVRSHSRLKKGVNGGQRQNQRRDNSVGFLNDYRRVNVALTRAKCSLWIVGNAEVLRSSDLWRRLIKQMDDQKVIRRGGEFKDLFAQWKASIN